MVTVTYRLIGSVDYPTFSKDFSDRTTANDWIAVNPIVVLQIESFGAATYNRVFGS